MSTRGSQKKSELFGLLLQKEGLAGPSTRIKPRGGAVDFHQPSFAQQRLWFLDQLDPGGAAYNLSAAIRLKGSLNVLALEKSLSEITRRHEVLRARFVVRDAQPRVIIALEADLRLPVSDLREFSEAEREEMIERLARAEAQSPFDLERGQLLRAGLLQSRDDEHVLLITMHHIISDGWSLGVFVRELATLYGAFVNAQSAMLPDLPIQYMDFAHWQREWLQGEVLERQLDYWRKQLADAPPLLERLTDYARPATQSFHGGRERLELSASLTKAVKELSREEGATVFMTLLASFKLLLHRLTGQDDVVVGSPIAGRNQPEVEGLIGFFVNTLALRTDLSGNPSFRELVRRVREVTLGAYAHQDLPFELLVEELQPERNLSHTPLFQVFFNMLNFPEQYDGIKLPGLKTETLSSPEFDAKFDLTLYAEDKGDKIQFDLVYNTTLFRRSRIREILEQLNALLSQAVSPEEQISRFSLLTPTAEVVLPDPTQKLISDWNGTAHRQFAGQAQRMPSNVALTDAHETWTYGELNARSNQLANYLRSGGIEPQEVVAIYGHRSASLVWAVLGVLKVGAAFVILDPSYPAPRLIECLGLVRPRGWLHVEAAGELPRPLEEYVEGLSCRCRLTLPPRSAAEQRGTLVDHADDDPEITVGPDDLAYLAFTSGSTGTPKVISGTHKALPHFLQWHVRRFNLGETDRFSMLSGLAHDPLLRDLFTPLWLGAALCIPEQEQMLDPFRLAQWMKQERINVAHITPALGQLLSTTREGEKEDARGESITLPHLRYFFFGGDLLTRGNVSNVRALAPAATCINFYGTTETPQAMGYFVVPTNEDEREVAEGDSAARQRESIPIGRGIEDVQLLVVNRDGLLCGIGEAGELYVRTPYLASGYFDDETLTRESFVNNPFTGLAADRLYRTGDWGRYLPDGDVEFLGRRDDQVKVRGYRVELGDIEAALEKHPSVRGAAVDARKDESGAQRLVAYVASQQEWPRVARELRDFLKDSLPEYMLPTDYVLLDELPLTPNGKIDRRALPAPERQSGEKGSFVAPRTPVEELLTDIWSEILGVKQVGVYDNFFELGGHSLLAAQLIARVRDSFALDLPLRSFFNAPTVAGLAVVVAESRQHSGYESSLWQLPAIASAPEHRHLPFPLTDIQQAYWVGRRGAVKLGNVASQRYVELEGTGLDLDRLNLAWRRLIERHDMLRAIVRPDGQQEILEQIPPYQIEVLDLSSRNSEERESELNAIRERMSGQELLTDRWPLFGISASRLDAERVRLHCAFDYLIADAWSFTLLFHELVKLYEHPETTLPPLDLSFRDYVLAQAGLKDSELYRRAKDYWQGRLPELPPAPELPLAQNPDALTRPRFVRRSSRLESATWQRLKTRANRAGLTQSGILLAAFADLLATWSHIPRFTVVLTLFNRLPMHPEVNHLVGDFTSTTLLAVDASEETFEARARALQEQLWHDLDHRYVSGVEVLREMMRTQGGTSRVLMPVVFTSTLNLRDATATGAVGARLVDLVYSISQTPQVFLDHQVFERDGALIFHWDAVEEVFPPGLLDDMFGAYCRLLEELGDGQTDWDEATRRLVPRAQLEQRAAVNSTAAEVSTEMLHTLFAAQVEKRGGHTALVSTTRRLTYDELSKRANQVGRRLRELGARPNKLVAVVMHKGWEQVVGVLGILNAGAAYLPINAALPQERIWYLLEDGQVDLVVTQSSVEEALQWPEHVACLSVDDDELFKVDDTPLPVSQGQDDLAYVIYTSGSTGLPKGVMIDHRGAVNTIIDINRRFRVTADDRVLALSSLSFDLSVYDIFGVLAAGGVVVIPDANASRDPAHWAELVQREKVTIWDSVPALMQILVEHLSAGYAGELDTLRLVMMSGDWVPVTLPEQIKRLTEGVEVVSLGGATEASIWSILYPVERVDPEWKSIPYGKPMLNQSFHVLNQALRPCPVWVVGDLYIGGVGLAKGYWRNEEKTRASFITNPHTGEKLYRTGDLGRYLPDGNIEFLGREDFQVKIQGYRIELGEIEAALAEHAGVRAGVVTALGEMRGSKRLVAYVVAEVDAALSAGEIQKFLREKLPEYMVPSTVVLLDSLPLTSNGKVNRQALPPPEQVRPQPGQADAPRTPMEEVLSKLCGEVLGVERVGVDDNFFNLGGNSLQAVQFAAQVRETFQIELPLRHIFDNPSVAGIVPLILQSQAEQLGDEEMAGLLEELEQLSVEEARQALTSETH